MIDIEELEYEYSAFFGDKEGEHNLLKRMKPLLAEVLRLREGIEQLKEQTWQANEEIKRLRKGIKHILKEYHFPFIISGMKQELKEMIK